MKWITIPGPVQMPKPNGGTQEFFLKDWHDQGLWPLPEWREDETSYRHFLEIQAKFEGIDDQPGEVVKLTDEEFEVYKPRVLWKGKNFPSGTSKELMVLLECVITTKNEDPRPNAKKDGDGVEGENDEEGAAQGNNGSGEDPAQAEA
jgi:hypothetical protein